MASFAAGRPGIGKSVFKHPAGHLQAFILSLDFLVATDTHLVISRLVIGYQLILIDLAATRLDWGFNPIMAAGGGAVFNRSIHLPLMVTGIASIRKVGAMGKRN